MTHVLSSPWLIMNQNVTRVCVLSFAVCFLWLCCVCSGADVNLNSDDDDDDD